MRTLWAGYAAAGETSRGRESPGRLFQHGFTYAAASGRMIRPFEAGMLCLRESDMRPVLQVCLRRLKTGRLFPVFCLLLVTCGILLVEPLRPFFDLSPQRLEMVAEAAAAAATLWFLYEATALSGRMSRRRALDWVMDRLRAVMLRR